jgi:hypothetical protein
MNWGCSKKSCEKCRRYKEKYLKQESKNDELVEMIESLLETQKKIVEYLDERKVVGVNIKKKTSQPTSKDK